MKVLIIDQNCDLLAMCIRAIDEGHDVKLWIPETNFNKPSKLGDGYVNKVKSWQPHAKGADLIITGSNEKYMREITPLFNQGYPVFGCNPKGAELELDRGKGQTLCSDYGIDTLPYEIFTSYDDAAAYVKKTMGVYVSKPWGGTADKSLSYVSGSPEDMIWKLSKWKEGGKLKGQIILQERIKGIEIAVGGWFGKSGWSKYICENFEEKKLMNDGLGQNTGEQGTTLRYVTESKLFDQCLAPITGYLHEIGYVGYVDQNCMIEPNGKAWPLEFTMRFGYPLCNIQNSLHLGDSMQWKLDAINGKDTLRVSDKVAVGVVVTHGGYPRQQANCPEDDGIPMYGLTPSMDDHVHFVEMRMGTAPVTVGSSIKEIPLPCSSGAYMVTVTGTASTVCEAAEKAYNICWKLKPPTNKMFRTDIGKRLKKQLPELQKNSFAEGMDYE